VQVITPESTEPEGRVKPVGIEVLVGNCVGAMMTELFRSKKIKDIRL
jgi:hypothetical protein